MNNKDGGLQGFPRRKGNRYRFMVFLLCLLCNVFNVSR